MPESQAADIFIDLTEVAAHGIRSILKAEGLEPEGGVRLSVSSGGCFGVSYTMEFVESPLTQDICIMVSGIRFFIPAFALPYIRELTIDYKQYPDGDEEFIIRSTGEESYPGSCSS